MAEAGGSEGWVRFAKGTGPAGELTPEDFNLTAPDQASIEKVEDVKAGDEVEVKVGLDKLFVRREAVVLGTRENTTSAEALGYVRGRDRFKVTQVREIKTGDGAKEYWMQGTRVR